MTIPHSALLLTSSGQIEVTKWSIGTNDTKKKKKNYQTDWLQTKTNKNTFILILPMAHFVTSNCALQVTVPRGSQISLFDPQICTLFHLYT